MKKLKKEIDLICMCGRVRSKHGKVLSVREYSKMTINEVERYYAGACRDFVADNLKYLKAKYDKLTRRSS